MSDDEEPIRLEWSEVPGTGEKPALPRIGFHNIYWDMLSSGFRSIGREPLSERSRREWRIVGWWAVGAGLVAAAAIVYRLGAVAVRAAGHGA